jgi:hypothetical protein
MQLIHQRTVGAGVGTNATTPAGPDNANIDPFHFCFSLLYLFARLDFPGFGFPHGMLSGTVYEIKFKIRLPIC